MVKLILGVSLGDDILDLTPNAKETKADVTSETTSNYKVSA